MAIAAGANAAQSIKNINGSRYPASAPSAALYAVLREILRISGKRLQASAWKNALSAEKNRILRIHGNGLAVLQNVLFAGLKGNLTFGQTISVAFAESMTRLFLTC